MNGISLFFSCSIVKRFLTQTDRAVSPLRAVQFQAEKSFVREEDEGAQRKEQISSRLFVFVDGSSGK